MEQKVISELINDVTPLGIGQVCNTIIEAEITNLGS